MRHNEPLVGDKSKYNYTLVASSGYSSGHVSRARIGGGDGEWVGGRVDGGVMHLVKILHSSR